MTSDEIGRWNEIKVKSSIFQIHLPFSELFKYEGLKVGGWDVVFLVRHQ